MPNHFVNSYPHLRITMLCRLPYVDTSRCTAEGVLLWEIVSITEDCVVFNEASLSATVAALTSIVPFIHSPATVSQSLTHSQSVTHRRRRPRANEPLPAVHDTVDGFNSSIPRQ